MGNDIVDRESEVTTVDMDMECGMRVGGSTRCCDPRKGGWEEKLERWGEYKDFEHDRLDKALCGA